MDTTSFNIEVRVADGGDGRTIRGIAVPWNVISYRSPYPKGERFKPGAFTKSVRENMGKRRFRLFRAHNYKDAVGIVTDLQPEAEDGLRFEARIARTPAGDAALNEVHEGLLDMSVGFRALRTKFDFMGIRDVFEGAFEELSLAPMAAYDGALITDIREAETATPPRQESLSDEREVIDLSRYKLPVMPKVDPKTGLAVVQYSNF